MTSGDGSPRNEERPDRYVKPEIVTYTAEDFLALLGPAQGYGGGGGGGPKPPVGGSHYGRLRRLFPGMR